MTLNKIRTPDIFEINDSKIQITTLGLKSLQMALSDGDIILQTDLEEIIRSLDLGEWHDAVATFAALPLIGNQVDDMRMVEDERIIYRWNGAAWVMMMASSVTNHTQLSSGLMNNDNRFVHLTAGELTSLNTLKHTHTNKVVLDNILCSGSGKVITDYERAVITASEKIIHSGQWEINSAFLINDFPAMKMMTYEMANLAADLVRPEYTTNYVRTKSWWMNNESIPNVCVLSAELNEFNEERYENKPLTGGVFTNMTASDAPTLVERTHILALTASGISFKAKRFNDLMGTLYMIGAKYQFEPQPIITDGNLYEKTLGWSASGSAALSISTAGEPKFIGSTNSLLMKFRNNGGSLTSAAFQHYVVTGSDWPSRMVEGCLGFAVNQAFLTGSHSGVFLRLHKNATNYYESKLSLFPTSVWKYCQFRPDVWNTTGTILPNEISFLSFYVKDLLNGGGRLDLAVDGMIHYE